MRSKIWSNRIKINQKKKRLKSLMRKMTRMMTKKMRRKMKSQKLKTKNNLIKISKQVR